MNSLLDKLNKVDIKPVDKISQEDKAFLLKLNENYTVVVNQLIGIRTLLKEQEKLNSNFEKHYQVSEYDSISVKDSSDDDGKGKIWGARCMYTFKYPLKHVQGLIQQAKHKVITDVVDYFNESYTLILDNRKYYDTIKKKEEKEIADLDHVVDWVLTQTGGLTLKEMGIKLLKDNFQSEVNGRVNTYRNTDDSCKLNGITLTFPNFMWYYQGNRLSYSHSDNRRYNSLIAAMIHFDNGSTETRYDMVSCNIPNNNGRGDYFDFTTPYETILDKVASMKFFKNGKVEVKFKTPDLAREFVEYYSIQLAAGK